LYFLIALSIFLSLVFASLHAFIFKNPAFSAHFVRSRQSPVHHIWIRKIFARFTARVLLRPGSSNIAGAVHYCMGGHFTDLKIWLFARSEEGENIKNICKKAWKIVSHNKL
jgi:hypothetical protein